MPISVFDATFSWLISDGNIIFAGYTERSFLDSQNEMCFDISFESEYAREIGTGGFLWKTISVGVSLLFPATF